MRISTIRWCALDSPRRSPARTRYSRRSSESSSPTCAPRTRRRVSSCASLDGARGTRETVRVKSATEYLWFETKKRREIVRITDDVAKVVEKSEVQEGFCLVSAMHITASIYVNDWEDGLIADIEEWANELAPQGPDYRHHQTGEDNGDAHLKRLLIGHQVMLPITKGKLDLGPWEQVFYAEWDGLRRKRVVVKAIGE